MKIRNISLMNYRNYEQLNIELGKDVNVFQGENAQGKTNILESIYFAALGRSHRTNKQRDLIKWDEKAASVKIYVEKERLDKTIMMNLLSDGRKSISVNKVKLTKIGDLLGILNVVMFSPEDLKIVKESPGVRRRFLDMEISQLIYSVKLIDPSLFKIIGIRRLHFTFATNASGLNFSIIIIDGDF